MIRCAKCGAEGGVFAPILYSGERVYCTACRRSLAPDGWWAIGDDDCQDDCQDEEDL